MSPEFWQRLLATDASTERLWLLFEGAKAAFLDGVPPSDWPGLSDAERRNVQTLPPEALVSALASGVTPLEQETRPGIPPALFGKGNPHTLSPTKIGIVGTRGASQYGKSATALFSQSFAESGCTVLSGGAIGIDSVAHESALEANGATVAVLPCGVDVAYPSRNRALFAKIAASGCLVSQFPCGAALREHWLPRRNILVAGLCDAVVVVEAPAKSGSLMTARAAQEFGKPVFVVPGPISQLSFKGSHDLIRNGAILVDAPEQVLEHMGVSVQPRDRKAIEMGTHEATVLESLSGVPQNLEMICMETNLKVDEVLTALTLLEIEGAVERSGDGYALKP